jgi:hypothetical protein|tara:strand:+ start:124 stop:288 length:165 start_codon:yes stop_codon:yes gene_type:complete
MEFKEVYCLNCKKTLGRYNSKFYSEEKIKLLLKTDHVTHVRSGHQVYIKKLKVD